MKEYLAGLVRETDNPIRALNIAREYLQARILGALQQSGAMIPLALQGGTALRFLYALPRSSEDLDFTLERPSPAYNFRDLLARIQRLFETEGYRIRLRISDRKPVHAAFVRFPGLLHDLGLPGQAEEAFAVKLEVDTRPPSGAGLEVTVVRRHIALRLQHHDRASLLAGKLHAILQRRFRKGRDFYDLLWYLSDPDWPAPNLALLNNALAQTGWHGPEVSAESWKGLIAARVQDTDFGSLRQDVLPFLENPGDADLLTRKDLLGLLA